MTRLPQLKAQALMKPVGRKLGRPVNVLAYTAVAWRNAVAKRDAFVQEVLLRPIITLKGDLHAIAKA